MVLAKINATLADYQHWLETTRWHPFIHVWESVRHFQHHWNLDTADPAAMFDSCFFNSETRRLWQTEQWEPKRMMSVFWKFDPLTVRLMFDDLLNETKEVEGRISRFLFGCDTLLRDYKKAHPASIENNHDHGDFKMIALYLAFSYPENYAPYDFSVFQPAMSYFQAKDIPQANDPARYFKVLRTLNAFIEKSPGIAKALQAHLNPRQHFQGKTLLLAADFCRFVAEKARN